MDSLEDRMRKFLGLDPYDKRSYSYGDGYTWYAMIEEFGKEKVDEMYNKLTGSHKL